ncbi:MAG: hypothetical protein K0S65_2884, partial [Labilithrix sp.]|nr:hypothetical protein [Labilithrix sp.]
VLHGTISAGQLALAQVPIEAWQSLTKIWGTSPTDIWVAGGDAVFHLQERAPGEAPAFLRMVLPSDYDPNAQLQLTALWGSGSEVWAAGSDRTWCDPVDCKSLSTLVVYKWKGGNEGASSWDRVRIPMGVEGGLPDYCTITAGASTSDGVQVLGLTIPDTGAGFILRVATNESLLSPGLDGIQHDGAYARTIDIVDDYIAPDGIWATDRKNIWLAGKAGVRRYDGNGWQIGRISVEQGVPVLRFLHAIHAAGPDMWIVGDDLALHRTVTP